MFKNVIKVMGVLLLAGFSFIYTEKATKIIREKDPIMIKINEIKKDSYVDVIKPIINNDEYLTGINGCEVDTQKSYDKMKTYGEFKNELLVMKEVQTDDIKDKYIVGGNKLNKNISLVFISKDDISNDLLTYLKTKNIKANFFVDQEFLEKNLYTIKFISEDNNIYYFGNNGVYDEDYMIYASNLIGINTNNESKFCLTDQKNEELLKLCSDYDMKTIKTNYIKDNLISSVKENLSNGAIITIDSSDIDKIKVVINYILYKGYNIVSLDELLSQSNTCSN